MEKIRQWLNDGGTYQDGVELFLEFSQDPDMCDLFTQESETEFKRKMLKQELLQLLKSANQPNAVQTTVSENKTQPTGGPPVASEKVTELSKELEETQDELNDAKDQIDDLEWQNEQLQDENKELQKTVKTKSPGRWSHPSKMDPVEKDLHDAWHPLFLEKSHLQSTIYDVATAGTKDPDKKIQAAQMAFRILDLARQCRKLYQQRDDYFVTGQVPVDPEPVKQYAIETAAAFKEWENAKRYVRQMKKNLAKNPDDENSKRLLAIHQATVEHHDKTFKK